VQLRTAKEWNIPPDEFFKKDKKTRAEMVATVEIMHTIDAYYSEWSQAQSMPDQTRKKR